MHLLFLLCKSIAKKQDAPFSRPFGATENDAQKLHALWLWPMIVVRNTAHEVLCHILFRGREHQLDAVELVDFTGTGIVVDRHDVT